MNPDNPTSWLDVIQSGGIVTFVLLVLWGNVKENPLWVSGREHKRQLEEKDREIERLRTREEWWQGFSLQALGASEQLIDLAKQPATRR